MNVETLSQYKALNSAYLSRNPRLVDLVLSGQIKSSDSDNLSSLPLKRIQFDAWEGLSLELESVCELLEVSKREFCELAIVEALAKAKTKFFETYRQATGEEFGGA